MALASVPGLCKTDEGRCDGKPWPKSTKQEFLLTHFCLRLGFILGCLNGCSHLETTTDPSDTHSNAICGNIVQGVKQAVWNAAVDKARQERHQSTPQCSSSLATIRYTLPGTCTKKLQDDPLWFFGQTLAKVNDPARSARFKKLEPPSKPPGITLDNREPIPVLSASTSKSFRSITVDVTIPYQQVVTSLWFDFETDRNNSYTGAIIASAFGDIQFDQELEREMSPAEIDQRCTDLKFDAQTCLTFKGKRRLTRLLSQGLQTFNEALDYADMQAIQESLWQSRWDNLKEPYLLRLFDDGETFISIDVGENHASEPLLAMIFDLKKERCQAASQFMLQDYRVIQFWSALDAVCDEVYKNNSQ